MERRTIIPQSAEPSGAGCEMDIPGPFCLVVFGATGDLSKRKIFPAVYRLKREDLLPENFFILGAGRSAMQHAEFRAMLGPAVRDASTDFFDENDWAELEKHIFYVRTDYTVPESFQSLRDAISSLERQFDTGGNRIFYLAIPPEAYEPVATNIGELGLGGEDHGYCHIVIEKPIGWDLDSARQLDRAMGKYFREEQIYRMDHYLAKETVQNILVFRFANSIFEPLWNRRYIDHVQITVSETLGIGHRAGYYDRAGVIRDMFQNHIFQLLSLTAMEAPAVFEAERVRDEKAKVLRSVRPVPLDRLDEFVVAGQYTGGSIGGEEVPGYLNEPGVESGSLTATYAAMKIYIDNWRWNGVPFYIRSGKRLPSRKAEISVHYKPVPHLMFAQSINNRIEPNVLVLKVQPDEGMSLSIQVKTQGSRICLSEVTMDYAYPKVFSMSDYERILLDCMQGDQMLFVRKDGVEQTWSLLSPVIAELESRAQKGKLAAYAAGSEGPEEADLLIRKDGRSWIPV